MSLAFASDGIDSLSSVFTEPCYLTNGTQSLSSSVTEGLLYRAPATAAAPGGRRWPNSSAAFTGTGEVNATSFSTSDAFSASLQVSSAAAQ